MLARVFSRVSQTRTLANCSLGVPRFVQSAVTRHQTRIQQLLAKRFSPAAEQKFHSSALLQAPPTFRSSDGAGAAAAAASTATGHHLPVHSADEVFFNRHAIDILQEKGIVGRADTIDEDATIPEAATRILQLSPPASLIVMKNGHVSGLLSERHILTCMATPPGESVFSDAKSWRVGKVMTPAAKMVVVSPQDTVYECLSVMISAGVRQLPVLDGQTLVGVLGLRDVVQHQQAALEEVAGQGHATSKAQFLTMILPRQGVPKNTAVLKAESSMLRLQSAATMIPHPHKKNSGEDAYLTWSYIGVEPTEKPHRKKKHAHHEPPRPTGLSVIAVADGVGSWSLEDGIDASLYSRGLLAHAKTYLETTAPQHPHLTPSQILGAAWHSISQEQVLGSSTVCLLTIDGVARQLRAANIGDSGFLVLRNTAHIVAGTLQNTQDAASPLRVIFRSVQQLHAFNTPAQLGSHEGSKFETPHDADLMTLQVDDGDLIVLATDGLFDNLEEADIVQLLGDGSEDVFVLSQRLADAAYTASLNKDKDSPFALLAKDNNILWSGGHPDDITVLVSRVFNAPTTTAETNSGLTCSVPRT